MSSGTWWERARGEETGDEAVGMSPTGKFGVFEALLLRVAISTWETNMVMNIFGFVLEKKKSYVPRAEVCKLIPTPPPAPLTIL